MVGRGQMERRLKTAPWLEDANTQAIFSLLDGEGERTRAVGGIVRDTLLGITREDSEIDFATELLQRRSDGARRRGKWRSPPYPTGIAHGTITLRLNDRVAEVTTLREDVETDGRHAVVKFGTDWGRDAARRDFTINALYADMFGDAVPIHSAAAATSPGDRKSASSAIRTSASPRTGFGVRIASSAFRRAMAASVLTRQDLPPPNARRERSMPCRPSASAPRCGGC